jgi:hypothetical protein
MIARHNTRAGTTRCCLPILSISNTPSIISENKCPHFLWIRMYMWHIYIHSYLDETKILIFRQRLYNIIIREGDFFFCKRCLFSHSYTLSLSTWNEKKSRTWFHPWWNILQYPIRSILFAIKMDVSAIKMCLDSSIFVSSNMNRWKYNFDRLVALEASNIFFR